MNKQLHVARITFTIVSPEPIDDVRMLREFLAQGGGAAFDAMETTARLASFATREAVLNDEFPPEKIGDCAGGAINLTEKILDAKSPEARAAMKSVGLGKRWAVALPTKE